MFRSRRRQTAEGDGRLPSAGRLLAKTGINADWPMPLACACNVLRIRRACGFSLNHLFNIHDWITMDYGAKFADGLSYEDFLAKYGSDTDCRRWDDFHAQVSLSDEQKSLLGSFVRDMQVLVMAGAWCGDCVNQCPIFDHFAQSTDKIQLRCFDRDDNPDLAAALQTCGAPRVPAVVFLAEDGAFCGRAGDRTLSKYRQMASSLTGAACSTGIGDSLTDAVVQDWLDEFERIQWMLRTSGRLRQLHGD